jgi:chromate transporter
MGALDPWALGLMVVAAVALFRFHLGIFGTLAITAALGVVVRVAGIA